MTFPDIDLAALAARNHRLIYTHDLTAMGVTDAAMRTVRKHLYRITRGAYTLDPPVDEAERHRLQVRAAIERHSHLVAATHMSAAVVHGLPTWGLDLRRVHVTGLDGEVREGVRHQVHTHHGPLPAADLTQVDSLRATTIPRTLIDCARRLPLPPAVVLVDHALNRGWATRTELERRCDALASVPGIDNVRRTLTLADERAESPGESRTRLTLTDGGIDVDSQVEVVDGFGRVIARADFQVKGRMVVVEFDGQMKYELSGDVAKAHWQEKLRHDRIQEAGDVIVRVTWADLNQPRTVVARVRAAMARADDTPAA